MAKELHLGNEISLGLHLSAGTSDHYLIEANQLYDYTRDQDIQTTLDSLTTGLENVFVYEGADAISIETTGDTTKEVSLVIASTDILSQSSSGLAATLSLNYDSDAKEVQLLGIDGAEISTIDATDFIKDGMLNNAVLYTATSSDSSLTEGNKYIVLSFNTDADSDPIYLDVNDLVDVYTGGNNIEITDSNVINVIDLDTDDIALVDSLQDAPFLVTFNDDDTLTTLLTTLAEHLSSQSDHYLGVTVSSLIDYTDYSSNKIYEYNTQDSSAIDLSEFNEFYESFINGEESTFSEDSIISLQQLYLDLVAAINGLIYSNNAIYQRSNGSFSGINDIIDCILEIQDSINNNDIIEWIDVE